MTAQSADLRSKAYKLLIFNNSRNASAQTTNFNWISVTFQTQGEISKAAQYSTSHNAVQKKSYLNN